MAQKTALSVLGTPGPVHAFVAKDEVSTALAVQVSAGVYYNDLAYRYVVPAIQTDTTALRRYFRSSGVWTSDTSTEIDTAQYDDGTDLANYTANKWAKGLFLVTPTEIIWLYPQAEYDTEADALAADLPTVPSTLADYPKSAAVVFQQGDSDYSQATWIDVRPLFDKPLPHPMYDMEWHYVGETGEPAFENSWVNYADDGTVAKLRFMKDASGIVHVQGVVKSGTVGFGNQVFTLPVGYRYNVGTGGAVFAIASNDAFGRVAVFTDGHVEIMIGENTYVDMFFSFYVG